MSASPITRILMTGDTVGGVWTFTLELAEALAAQNVDVMLATLGALPRPAQAAEAARVPNLHLLPSSFKLEWMDDPWRDVEESGAWLLELEKHYQPDIVHLNSFGHGALPWRAPVVLTAHSCVVSWWEAVKREPLPDSWNRYRSEVEFALKSSDLVTSPSRAMLETLFENYGRDLPPCRVVPNGRNAARFRTGPKEQFILAAGRLWDEAKNISALAAIAPRMNWPVYIAGDSQHPNGSAAQFDGCHFVGRLDPEALAGWYARAAIYALPARYEPFGLSALEAALSGCALVLGDIASLREIWGDCAIFVPPDDPEALVDALTRIDQTHEMARRACDRARSFTPQRMAAEYLEAYNWVADRRRLACAS